jgi:hypothetical protein
MKRTLLWCTILMLACVAASVAQSLKVPESWDKLAAKADEVVNVKMDRKMLSFASKFMDDDNDAEGKQLISKLNGIYVRSLEFKTPGEFTQADVEPIRAQLQGPEWSRIVDVDSKSDKEKVTIYIKSLGDQTVGMVILAEEPTELTFVDLDGPINPHDLDGLSGNFGIPKGIHARSKNTVTTQPASETTVKK